MSVPWPLSDILAAFIVAFAVFGFWLAFRERR